jgi:hypothetical protein
MGRHGQLMEAEAAHRTLVGEPLVRDRTRQSLDWGWTFLCPFPGELCGLGSLHVGFDTADHCRAGWIAHCRDHHPTRPCSWPAHRPGVVPPPFTGFQVVPKPRYEFHVDALVHAGVLVDLVGTPLRRVQCSTCRARHRMPGQTCPLTLPCPSPYHTAATGRRCPVAGDGVCLIRSQVAELVDAQRVVDGDQTVPAPWREPLRSTPAAEQRGQLTLFEWTGA